MINLLHIDDNPDDLELSQLLFRHITDEVTVSVAGNASEAAKSIAHNEFDCIICDYNLPDVDGVSFLQNLRDTGDTTTFIMLTGQGDEEVAALAMRNGADDYYVKKAGTAYYKSMLERIKKLNDKKKEKQLKLEEAVASQNDEHYLFAATDSMQEAIFVLSENDHTIQYCNKAVNSLFGFSPDDLLNKHMEELVLSKIVYEDLLDAMAQQHNGAEPINTQLSMKTRNNEIIIADVTLSRFHSNNGMEPGYTVVVRDNSRTRVRELALKDHSKSLEGRVDQLTKIKEEYESFVYTVSHDLKGHVNNIVEFSDIIHEELFNLTSDDIRKYVQIINKTSMNLKKMLDGLFSLSKAANAELKLTEINMGTIAESLLNEFVENHPERDIKFHVEKDMVIRGDEGLIHSAIRNLISNSLKYTSTRDQTEITFSFMEEGTRKVYFVEDNGIGFDEEKKDMLFAPFKRLHEDNKFPGTGLGLAIVERIIRRHGGKIWADSELDEGTSFFFTLGR